MPSCFVVMGYGKKPDYEQNKTFDLDKSYHYIIKPAVEAAGYACIRADEIQHAGNINIPMYEQLLNADLVIADLSTSNLNAFFELGVRYALKPRTTIVISEKGFKIPFDMGQVVIRNYEHLGTGIDFGEVQRMKQVLTEAIAEVVKGARADSPVYTFLTKLKPPAIEEIAAAEVASEKKETQHALAAVHDEHEKAALTTPMAALMESAMTARARKDFKKTREILRGVLAVQGENVDPFVVQQLALATYKSPDLEPRQALLEARDTLQPLRPEVSSDPETLGLWGAIHKRLSELPQSPEAERGAALDTAIWAYEKGFYLCNDYYNGINFAFLLNCRAAKSAGEDAIADRVQARRVRLRVLMICDELLTSGIKGESPRSKAEQEYWVRATRVEALCGLQRRAESEVAFTEATNMEPKPEAWMIDSTAQQLAVIASLPL